MRLRALFFSVVAALAVSAPIHAADVVTPETMTVEIAAVDEEGVLVTHATLVALNDGTPVPFAVTRTQAFLDRTTIDVFGSTLVVHDEVTEGFSGRIQLGQASFKGKKAAGLLTYNVSEVTAWDSTTLNGDTVRYPQVTTSERTLPLNLGTQKFRVGNHRLTVTVSPTERTAAR